MNIKLESAWKEALAEEFNKAYYRQLTEAIEQAYANEIVYPPSEQIFRAFAASPFHETKVVVLGQDPYHGPGQANGLCFSVAEGLRLPPSLVNIYKALKEDLGKPIPTSGDLGKWAEQGVLLLNASLTVRHKQANSHAKLGWQQFTDAAVKALATKRKGLVYMLWGSFAQKKAAVVNSKENLVLKAPHPSPLSAYRGFFDCRHFSKANAYLEAQGQTPIEW